MRTTKPVQTLRKGEAGTAAAHGRPRGAGSSRKLVPYAIGLGLLLAIGWGLWPKRIEVESSTVANGPMTVSVLEEGKTRIRHRHTVSPPVAGFLNRVALRAGDRIEAGTTVLATLQPEPASFLNPRAQAEAEARVNAARAARLRSQSQLERARAALELAEKEKERAQSLHRKGAIAAREWDAAQNEVEILSRDLRAAEFALQVAEFEVTQAEAALQQVANPAPEGAEPLRIIAPITGFVLNVFEESARIVAAGTPIMEVGDPTDLEAEIELLSSDAVGVQPGAEVSIEQWGGDRPLRGKVAVVEPGGFTKISALGVEEQRVRIRVNFVDPLPASHQLGDRYRVEARIVTWNAPNVLQVPTGALFRRGNDWMVFALDGSKARLNKLEIGHNNGVAAEVRSGLHEGDRVILHPPDTIVDGKAVRPRAAN